jgi:hypothetical protein
VTPVIGAKMTGQLISILPIWIGFSCIFKTCLKFRQAVTRFRLGGQVCCR